MNGGVLRGAAAVEAFPPVPPDSPTNKHDDMDDPIPDSISVQSSVAKSEPPDWDDEPMKKSKTGLKPQETKKRHSAFIQSLEDSPSRADLLLDTIPAAVILLSGLKIGLSADIAPDSAVWDV